MFIINALKRSKNLIGDVFTILNAILVLIESFLGIIFINSEILKKVLLGFIFSSGLLAFYLMPEMIRKITANKLVSKRSICIIWCIISFLVFLSIISILRPGFVIDKPILLKLNSFFITFPLTNIILGLLAGIFTFNFIIFINLYSPKTIKKIFEKKN